MATQSSSSNSTSAAPALSHERIAERARELWMHRGSPAGRDLEHWLEAERQLRNEQQRSNVGKNAPSNAAKQDLAEAEKRLDGLIENKPSPARRTPSGEQI